MVRPVGDRQILLAVDDLDVRIETLAVGVPRRTTVGRFYVERDDESANVLVPMRLVVEVSRDGVIWREKVSGLIAAGSLDALEDDELTPDRVIYAELEVTNYSFVRAALVPEGAGERAGLSIDFEDLGPIPLQGGAIDAPVQVIESAKLNNVTAITVTFNASTAVGNLLVVACMWSNNTFTSIADDSGSNTYLLTTQVTQSSRENRTGYVKNGATGTHAVTLTTSGPSNRHAMFISEWSADNGWDTDPIDVEEDNAASSSHSALDVNDLPVATTVADALLFANHHLAADRAITEPSGWTDGGAEQDRYDSNYRIVSSTSSYAASASYDSAITNSVGTFIAFGEAAAGGGRIMSSLVGAGGLAGPGGIAGRGGGLAG